MIHTSTNTLDRTGLPTKPTGADDKKAYSIKCYTKDDWIFIHEELEKDGSLEDNIPDPSIAATVSSTNVLVKFTPESGISGLTTYRFVKTLIQGL